MAMIPRCVSFPNLLPLEAFDKLLLSKHFEEDEEELLHREEELFKQELGTASILEGPPPIGFQAQQQEEEQEEPIDEEELEDEDETELQLDEVQGEDETNMVNTQTFTYPTDSS